MRKALSLGMIFILLLVTFLTGCGGGGKSASTPGGDDPVTPQTRYLYAVNFNDSQISAFKISNIDGKLTALSSAATQPEPRDIALHPGRNHLFVCTDQTNVDTNDYIEIFGINADNGSLSLKKSIKLESSQSRPSEMAFTPDGKYLCITHHDHRKALVYSVDLTTDSIQLVTSLNTITEPNAITVHPNGKYLYIAKNGVDFNSNGEVQIYDLSSAGNATLKTSISVGRQPTAMTFNPASSQLYVTNFTSGSLMVFSVSSSDGLLTLKNTYPSSSNIAVSPGDKFVFTGYNGINAYSISGSTLNLVEGSPFGGSALASSLAVEPSDRFLYVSRGYATGYERITAYSIDVLGKLTLVEDYDGAGGSRVLVR